MRIARPPICLIVVVALAAALAPAYAFAQEPVPRGDPPTVSGPPPDARPDQRGPGASGMGDGSGMGQDTTEAGTPKGLGDKGGPSGAPVQSAPACADGSPRC